MSTTNGVYNGKSLFERRKLCFAESDNKRINPYDLDWVLEFIRIMKSILTTYIEIKFLIRNVPINFITIMYILIFLHRNFLLFVQKDLTY